MRPDAPGAAAGGGGRLAPVTPASSIPLGEATRERLVEAARLATVGRLVPSLVHQISTPLASIALRAESLERSVSADGGDDRARRYLGAIVRETAICRELMALAREYARPVSPESGAVDVNALCRDAARFVLHEAMRRQVEVRLDLEEALPRPWGREGRLRQAVLALVLNGVDASPAAAVVVVSTRRDAESLSVAVADGGEGVAPEAAARLGEPFVSTRERGLGLGLFACRAIAEEHGGDLVRDDGPGGARFAIRLRPDTGPLGGRPR